MSDGQTIYFGNTSDAVQYFEKIGWVCPPLWNAADFLLDLIATDYRSAQAEQDTKARIATLYQKHLEREGLCTCPHAHGTKKEVGTMTAAVAVAVPRLLVRALVVATTPASRSILTKLASPQQPLHPQHRVARSSLTSRASCRACLRAAKAPAGSNSLCCWRGGRPGTRCATRR